MSVRASPLGALFGLMLAVSCGGGESALGGARGASRDAAADASMEDAASGRGGAAARTGGAGGAAGASGSPAGGAGGMQPTRDAGVRDAAYEATAPADGAAKADSSLPVDGAAGVDAAAVVDGANSVDASADARDSSSVDAGGFLVDAAADAVRIDASPDGVACVGSPDAQADVVCARDGDCCASGRVCGDIRSGVPYCSEPFATGQGLGASCSGAFVGNGACSSGICLALTGQCTAVCSGDSDCRARSTSSHCHGFTVSGLPVGLCVQGCTGDPACGDGSICVIRDDAQRDRVDRYCRAAPDTGFAPGTSCTNGAQCDHGLCAFVGQDQFCSTPCQGDSDCPAAVPVCRDFSFLTPVSGQTVQMGMCSKT